MQIRITSIFCLWLISLVAFLVIPSQNAIATTSPTDSLTYTWDFDDDDNGWVALGAASARITWDTDHGNGNGGWEWFANSIVGNSPTTGSIQWTGTWEDLGFPHGSRMLQITTPTYQYSMDGIDGVTQTTGPYWLRDDEQNVLKRFLRPARKTVDVDWTTRNGLNYSFTPGNPWAPSNATIIFDVLNAATVGGQLGSAYVWLDNVGFTMLYYLPPAAGIHIKGGFIHIKGGFIHLKDVQTEA